MEIFYLGTKNTNLGLSTINSFSWCRDDRDSKFKINNYYRNIFLYDKKTHKK